MKTLNLTLRPCHQGAIEMALGHWKWLESGQIRSKALAFKLAFSCTVRTDGVLHSTLTKLNRFIYFFQLVTFFSKKYKTSRPQCLRSRSDVDPQLHRHMTPTTATRQYRLLHDTANRVAKRYKVHASHTASFFICKTLGRSKASPAVSR